jgi:hypothetical protein
MVIVTGALAAAGLRYQVVSRWLAGFSVLITAVMAAATFLPFVNWFPALVWTLVTSLAMLATAPSSTRVVEPARP